MNENQNTQPQEQALPELTLTPFAEPEKKPEPAPAAPAVLDESSLSPAEQQAVAD